MVGPVKVQEDENSFFEAGSDDQHRITCIDHKDGWIALGVSCYGSPQWTGQVELWKALPEGKYGIDGQQIGKIDVGSGVSDVLIISEDWILLSTHAGFWALLDTLNFKCVCRGVEHNAAVTKFAVSPDAKFVATCSADGNVKVWDVSKWTQAKPTLATGAKDTEVVVSIATCWAGGVVGQSHSARVNDLLWRGEDELVSCSADGTIRLWNTKGEQLARYYDDTVFRTISFVDAKQDVLLAGDDNGRISLIDLKIENSKDEKANDESTDEKAKVEKLKLIKEDIAVPNPDKPPALYTNVNHRDVYQPNPITAVSVAHLSEAASVDCLPWAIITHSTPGVGFFAVDACESEGKKLLQPVRLVSEQLLKDENAVSASVRCSADAKFIVVGRKVFTAHPDSQIWE
jgi:WD40 repeat protein